MQAILPISQLAGPQVPQFQIGSFTRSVAALRQYCRRSGFRVDRVAAASGSLQAQETISDDQGIDEPWPNSETLPDVASDVVAAAA